MSRKNEDSIEKFFRKGLRQSDTTFRESDWLDLEKRLEEQTQLRAAARAQSLRRAIIAGSGILLMAVSLYFFVPEREPDQQNDLASNEQSTVQVQKSTVHPDASRQAGPQSTANAEQSATQVQRADGRVNQPNGNTRSTIENIASTDTQAQQADAKHINSGEEQSTVHLENSEPRALGSPHSTAQDSKLTDTKTRTNDRVKQTSNTSLSTAQKTALTDTKMLRANDRAKRTNNNGEQPAVQNTTSKDIQAQLADDRAKRTSSIEQLAVQNQNAEPTAQQADERAGKTNSSPRSMTQNTESKDTQLQNTPPATKPRQTERSEAPANSKPVVAAPTVANASERSGRGVDIEKEAEQSTTPKPSTVDSGLSTDRTKPTVNSSTSAPITTSDSVAVDRRLSTLDSLSHNDAPSKEPVTDKEENDKPPIRSRWNAALVVAPDFSSTGFGGEMSAPGQAFGGMIGYRISRKFTVVGGVIRSSKKYTGYGKDYEPPDGYWQKRTNGVVPDAIKGSCTIIEVPIAVQLDVWQNTRARLYVSGGVSSYFMRHEKYDYSFNEPNEGADRSWGSDIPTSYAFKVGHLSAAYEMMLTKNLGVSVEPYIKIPFQGIGWANLSLYTAGAYVNVRYFLLRKNVE